ncbi:ATP-binding protein [Aestuariispira ectoiniformans]|uniref:ATP-binding protein n=1 Tax=Aestuariispira ectoiniformans TaxID=2775080 RepID=UPI00223A7E4D|nr:ATP-binding protein [Aestuariispira ectoiniformans]
MTEVPRRIYKAVYCDPGLPEYRDNPLIAALPAIRDSVEVARTLRQLPAFDNMEQALPGVIRQHAIMRLLDNFFQPLTVHLELESKLSLLIRGGYTGRNPKTGAYYSQLQNGYERLMQKDLKAKVFETVRSTAKSLAFIGCSGCGKTTALNRILSTYPQALFHEEYNITQLTYLKLDCPHDGTLKSLCYSFFQATDRILDTDYTKRYGSKRLSLEVMLARMAHLANLHALGVLVIDEIQHLNEAKSGGIKKMLNFFVTLVNTIGVPVVMVGTPKARGLFGLDMRTARRAAGMGSLDWDRMLPGSQWDAFTKLLWKYQWLQKTGPLDDELRQTFYDLSQGVIDVAVKLFALSQHRAIVTQFERISPGLLRQVYEDEFRPVHPMLKALREGDYEAIALYGDLEMPPVSAQIVSAELATRIDHETVSSPSMPSGSKAGRLVDILKSMGVQQDVAIPLVDEFLARKPNLPLATAIHELTKFAVKAPDQPAPKRAKPVKRSQWNILDSDDLRSVLANGVEGKAYEAFEDAGIVLSLKEGLPKSA